MSESRSSSRIDSPIGSANERSSLPAAKTMLWTGRVMTGAVALFLALDGVIKVLQLAPAVEATTQLGYAASVVPLIGVIDLLCLAVYLFPRSSVLGAILLTGYLGGAVATHLRAGQDLFPLLFPVMIGLLVWGGLFLRDQRLRALIPLRSAPPDKRR